MLVLQRHLALIGQVTEGAKKGKTHPNLGITHPTLDNNTTTKKYERNNEQQGVTTNAIKKMTTNTVKMFAVSIVQLMQ